MGFLDIILGGLLGYSFYKGLRNGLFVELASLVSLLAGVYFAVKFSSLMKGLLSGFLHWNPHTIQVIAFILTFVVVIVAISFLGKFLTKMADFAYLGLPNQLGGGFFRTLKIVLILGVVFNLFGKINYNNFLAKKETLDNSLFYNPIQKTAGFLYPSIGQWYTNLKKK